MNSQKLYLFIFSIFIHSFTESSAQGIGINTAGAAPNASAALDVDVTNKGLLIPRVSLTSVTDVTTIAGPATSLLVYNTGTGGLSPAGFYYWNGSQWAALGGSSGGSFSTVQAWGTAGTYLWTVPPGVTKIVVEAWGAGGGGGAGSSSDFAPGGGGGGYGKEIAVVTPGNTLTVTVGAGGSGGVYTCGNGGNGGSTGVTGMGSPANIGATGGLGGLGCRSNNCDGNGAGGNSTATISMDGQSGKCGYATGHAEGGNAGNGGAGGVPGRNGSGVCVRGPGIAPGGGGSGSYGAWGLPLGLNDGAAGRVIIYY